MNKNLVTSLPLSRKLAAAFKIEVALSLWVVYNEGMVTIWKPIKSYEGLYKVSNMGQVKATRRSGSRGSILKPAPNKQGDLIVGLSKNNKRSPRSINRIVAKHFVKGQKPNAQVNHKDGDKANNRASNLEWLSAWHHQLHTYHVLNKRNQGETNGRAKLTEREVKFLRILFYNMPDTSRTWIAEFYGMSRTSINLVLTFKNWKDF